jgi:methylated-DNA-[protein]-cysteine S-methyltransferase
MKRLFQGIRTLAVDTMDSPIGRIRIYVSPRGLVGVDLPGKEECDPHALVGDEESDLDVAPRGDARTGAVKEQLTEYFKGKRKRFQLPLAPHGGEFDSKVWARVATIPYGATATYGDVARDIGHPTAFRAVGAANGRNPIPIVIPCHRVIGSGGRITGFGGGLPLKVKLLAAEGLELSKGALTPASRIMAGGAR